MNLVMSLTRLNILKILHDTNLITNILISYQMMSTDHVELKLCFEAMKPQIS